MFLFGIAIAVDAGDAAAEVVDVVEMGELVEPVEATEDVVLATAQPCPVSHIERCAPVRSENGLVQQPPASRPPVPPPR